MTKSLWECKLWRTDDETIVDRSSFTFGRVLLLVASCLLLAGCGCSHGPNYPTATVSGMVTVDDKPVPKGFITFSPMSQGQGSVVGTKIVEGKYRCEKIPLGKQRVTFTAQAAEMAVLLDHSTGTNQKVPKNILPPKYSAGLEAEVKAGEATLDFPLKSNL